MNLEIIHNMIVAPLCPEPNVLSSCLLILTSSILGLMKSPAIAGKTRLDCPPQLHCKNRESMLLTISVEEKLVIDCSFHLTNSFNAEKFTSHFQE